MGSTVIALAVWEERGKMSRLFLLCVLALAVCSQAFLGRVAPRATGLRMQGDAASSVFLADATFETLEAKLAAKSAAREASKVSSAKKATVQKKETAAPAAKRSR